MPDVTKKAERAIVWIDDIEINAYLLPSGNTKLAGRNITDAVNEPANSLLRIMGVKSLKDLPGAIEGQDEAGYTIVLLPVSIAIDYWSIVAAKKGNRKAFSLLTGISDNPSLLGLPDEFHVAIAFPSDIEKERANLAKRRERRTRASSPERCVEENLSRQIIGCQRQVLTPVGQIDILSSEEVIEIKNVRAWKAALGQVLVYGKQYPSHRKRIHLFGSVHSEMKQLIESECASFDVTVTWEPVP